MSDASESVRSLAGMSASTFCAEEGRMSRAGSATAAVRSSERRATPAGAVSTPLCGARSGGKVDLVDPLAGLCAAFSPESSSSALSRGAGIRIPFSANSLSSSRSLADGWADFRGLRVSLAPSINRYLHPYCRSHTAGTYTPAPALDAVLAGKLSVALELESAAFWVGGQRHSCLGCAPAARSERR